MNLVTYVLIQAELADLTLRVRGWALEEFIQSGERAELLGPVTDPTLYRDAGGWLREILRLARAAKDFRDATRDIPEAWLAGLIPAPCEKRPPGPVQGIRAEGLAP